VHDTIVGYDARHTSEAFHNAAIKGFIESGINVVDIGTCTTPMAYWAQYHLNVLGLCMITASHNPTGWNGLKLGTGLSKTLLSDELALLHAHIAAENYVNGSGLVRREDVTEAYLSDLVSHTSTGRPLKVLVNTGNGTAGLFVPQLLRRAGYEVVEHYTEVDTTYPHYTANPDGLAMMEDTGVQTRAHACDIGLAFDGDGDRLGVVDEQGSIVWPDRYLILLSRLVLAAHPGAKIVFDVKVSEALPEDIRAHGGVPIMWKTGHSYIKAKLAEEQAALAGEMSGHIFFNEGYYGFDDALFAALKMLEYLSHQEDPLSSIVAGLPYYISTPTIQVPATDESKYDIVDAVVGQFKKEGYRVFDINGGRVYMEGGWGLVRASSNTPTLVLRFEAKTKEQLEAIQAVFKEKLSRFPEVSQEWDSSGH
jgi:phosphomannomutase / phosphoglucomutase